MKDSRNPKSFRLPVLCQDTGTWVSPKLGDTMPLYHNKKGYVKEMGYLQVITLGYLHNFTRVKVKEIDMPHSELYKLGLF